GRLRAELEPPGGEELAQQLLGARFLERHLAGAHALDLGRIDVVDANPIAGVRERQRERQAYVAAPADDHDIQGFHGGQIMMPVTWRPPFCSTSGRCRARAESAGLAATPPGC